LATPVRYDVVVVGGGTAGCVLAGRLSEDSSRTVCLVEAGPDYGPYADGRWPADILDGRWLALESHRWEQEDEDDRSQARARVLGGCSAHNACILLEGAPGDYDEWGEGWSYEAIEPYLRRAERQMLVRRLEPEELSPWHRAFAEACGDAAIVHPANAMGTVR
jgi:choline dehydrogenase-like flavoprotein